MDERSAEIEEVSKPVEEEPVVTKLVQSSELDSPVIEPWKLSSFEQEESASAASELSEEVYLQMQKALEPKLQQQAEVLKQEAYDKAYQKGYEEGLIQGQQEGEKKGEAQAKAEVLASLEPKLENFSSIIDSLQKPYDLLEQRLYSELVDFALHIAKTVVHKSVAEQKDWIIDAVQQSVATLPESNSEINVYLHPDDLAFIQISRPSISESWQLHESANVAAGTCIVKQDYSTVLNSWEARFDEIAEQISQDSAINIQPEKHDSDSQEPTEVSTKADAE